jgi:hypothetical protein
MMAVAIAPPPYVGAHEWVLYLALSLTGIGVIALIDEGIRLIRKRRYRRSWPRL